MYVKELWRYPVKSMAGERVISEAKLANLDLSDALAGHRFELWRYPVKSMAGERVTQIQVGELGFADDRKVLVRAGNGHVVTSRTHRQLLGLKGTLGADGQPQI